MRWIIWALTIFILLIFESGVLGHLGFLPFLPGLVPVFAGISLAFEARRDSIFLVLISGIMLDWVSGFPDGVFLLALILSSAVVYVVVSWLLHKDLNLAIMFVAVLAQSLLFFILVLILAKLFSLLHLGVGADYAYLLTHKLWWYILFNMIAAYPVYLYYLLAKRLIEKRFQANDPI